MGHKVCCRLVCSFSAIVCVLGTLDVLNRIVAFQMYGYDYLCYIISILLLIHKLHRHLMKWKVYSQRNNNMQRVCLPSTRKELAGKIENLQVELSTEINDSNFQ